MNVFRQLSEIHSKMNFYEGIDKIRDDPEKLRAFMELRIAMKEEELKELKEAWVERDAEEIVDALVDGVYFDLGTLNFLVGEKNSVSAFNEVHRANMDKKPGAKSGRPNPLGLPDMIKPEGWKEPNHGEFLNGLIEDVCKS